MKVAVIQADLRDTTGTQQFTTSSGFGTPKAALIIATRADSSDPHNSEAAMSIGFRADASTCVHQNRRNGPTTSDCFRGRASGHVGKLAQATSELIKLTFSQWVTDGIELTVTVTTNVPASVTIVLFGGDTLSAKVNTLRTNNTGNDQAISVGFEPDCVFMASYCHSGVDTGSSLTTFGVTLNKPTPISRGVTSHSADNYGSSNPTAFFNETWAAQQVDTSTDWGVRAANFDSSGFDLVKSQNLYDYIEFLSLKDTDHSFHLETMTTPTSTGTQSSTGPGFTPQAMLLCSTLIGVVEERVADATSAWFGVGATDGTTTGSQGISDEDAAADMVTDSHHSTALAECYQPADSSDAIVADLDSFDAEGYTLDFTTVDATYGQSKKWWVLAFEGDADANPDHLYSAPLIY